MIRVLSVLRQSAVALCAGGCLLSSGSAAEPVELGPDLGYLRVHSIVEEREAITTALIKFRALVLDLRYPLDERDAGETLRQELATHAAKPRLYVLVSPATPVPVVGIIASSPVRWLVTLGVKGSRPEPQVVVQQSAEADRAAYDAIAAGTALTQLTSGRIEKERFDEASLVQEFKNGNHNAHPPVTGQAKGTEAPVGPAGSQAERLTDRVLQRAVHLHSALLALRR